MSKTIELIVLIALICVTYYFYKKSKAQADSQKAAEKTEEISKYILTVKIEGMMCGKCAARVTEGLSQFGTVTINLEEKTASIESNELADAVAVEEKINELGFKFEGIVE